MDKHATPFLVIYMVVILVAGCAGVAPQLPNETTKITPVPATAPVNNQTCTADTDCVPAQCCHLTSCVDQASVDVCNFPCTTSCEVLWPAGSASAGA